MSELAQAPSEQSNKGLSRRDLFRTAGLATGGAMLLGLPNFLTGWTGTAEAALQDRSYATTTLALELDGQFAGLLRTMSGGGLFTDIIPEGTGQDMVQRKRPGPVRFEDIVLEVNLGSIDKPLSSWVTDTLTKSSMPPPKNGAIVYGDMNGNQVKRLEFTGAVLTEVLVSDCVAAEGKTPLSLRLRLIPQSTVLTGGKGKMPSMLGAKGKQILASNFRFNVQGLEAASPGIMKVQGMGATRMAGQKTLPDGKLQQPGVLPGTLDCSLVRIAVREQDAGPFYKWFNDMVVGGNPNAQRGGLLEWLDPTLKNVVASVQLGGLGIVRYSATKAEVGKEALSAVEIDMYCETMNLMFDGPDNLKQAPAAAPPPSGTQAAPPTQQMQTLPQGGLPKPFPR